MLGEFINSILVIILGFAYPAFECFKTLERSRVDINDLRFWCQYWIIVAILSIIERFGDIFISWVPMYAEMKLGFIIYLWYPKTKGTSYVYETLLRPFVVRHETDIDQYLEELRYKAWDAAIFYWQNCTELGQGAFFQVFDFLMNQSSRLRGGGSKRNINQQHPRGGAPPPAPQRNINQQHPRGGGPPPPASQPPPPPPAGPSNFIPPSPLRQPNPDHFAPSSPLQRRRVTPEPSAPPMPGAAAPYYRSVVQPAKSQVVQVNPDDEAHTEYVHIKEEEALGMESSPAGSLFAGLRLRRSR